MEEYIDTTEALEIAKKKGIDITLPTLITWCDEYHIGVKIGGRWRVKPNLLKLMLDGQQWRLDGKNQQQTRSRR